MKAQPSDPQKVLFLFSTRLVDMLDPAHPLVRLANEIEWSRFDEAFAPMFCADNGAPAIRTRLMVGLHYLKNAFNVSDEDVVARRPFVLGIQAFHDNPYDGHTLSASVCRRRTKIAGCDGASPTQKPSWPWPRSAQVTSGRPIESSKGPPLPEARKWVHTLQFWHDEYLVCHHIH